MQMHQLVVDGEGKCVANDDALEMWSKGDLVREPDRRQQAQHGRVLHPTALIRSQIDRNSSDIITSSTPDSIEAAAKHRSVP
jgi:hypothetical protein